MPETTTFGEVKIDSPLMITPTESIRSGAWTGAKGFRSDSQGSAVSGIVSGLSVISQGSFGGDGTGGNYELTSGASTIDLGSAATVIKNFKNFKITGDASLSFTNPNANGTLIVIKALGDVVITSTTVPAIDLRSLGGTAGAGGAAVGSPASPPGGGGGASASTNGVNGVNGGSGGGAATAGKSTTIIQTVGGGAISDAGNGGLGGTSPDWLSGGVQMNRFWSLPGGGGAGGTGGTAAGGAGGRGGGGLLIECKGKLNFTSTINASGANGGTAAAGGGGGGGGGAGSISIIYKKLVVNTGTLTVTGGTGGGGSNNGGGGGAGYGSVVAG